jgi:hypothetical protein
MSVAAGFARTAVSPAATPAPLTRRRALLTVVPVGETAAPRAPFAFAVVALLVTGLIGLLVLNTVLGKDAFKLHALQVEGRKLADTEQVLTREVEALRAPTALAEKAAALGMVDPGPPAFLRLPDGAVLGSAVPAAAPGELQPAPQAQAPAQPPADEAADEDQGEPAAQTEDEAQAVPDAAADATTNTETETSEDG